MKNILFILLFLSSSVFAFEDLNDNNFDEKIAGKKVIVDFYSQYWGSCKILGKNMTIYSTSSKPDDVEIYKVEIGKQKAIAARYNAFAVPMLIYFKNGKEIAREIGVRSVKQLEKNVNKYLK